MRDTKQWEREWPELAGKPEGLKLMASKGRVRRFVFAVLGTFRHISRIPEVGVRARLVEPYWRERKVIWDKMMGGGRRPLGAWQLTTAMRDGLRGVRRQINEDSPNRRAAERRAVELHDRREIDRAWAMPSAKWLAKPSPPPEQAAWSWYSLPADRSRQPAARPEKRKRAALPGKRKHERATDLLIKLRAKESRRRKERQPVGSPLASVCRLLTNRGR